VDRDNGGDALSRKGILMLNLPGEAPQAGVHLREEGFNEFCCVVVKGRVVEPHYGD
jgi:hypothetical protein